jgi:hypothetical protein
MTVAELIKQLEQCPPSMEVCIWDHDEDENMPVVQVLHESGVSHIQLLTHEEETVPASEP